MAYTAQQERALRSNRHAQTMVKRFPVGSRVKTGNHAPETSARGTVVRLVPQLNSLGGYVVVEWDSGATGRHNASCLVRDGDEHVHVWGGWESAGPLFYKHGGQERRYCECGAFQTRRLKREEA